MKEQPYPAMYSSVFGGIVLDSAMMVIPIDDHMVHRGHGVFDTAIILNGWAQYFSLAYILPVFYFRLHNNVFKVYAYDDNILKAYAYDKTQSSYLRRKLMIHCSIHESSFTKYICFLAL